MRSLLAILTVNLLFAAPALAADPGPFVPVFIDQKTMSALGPFPYDRSVYARTIEKAAEYGAKGVVLKLLLLASGTDQGDQALATAMARTPVLLQAVTNDHSESDSNELLDRFVLPDIQNDRWAVAGHYGMLPLPAFAAVAADVGFVDVVTAGHPPMIEQCRGASVKSLMLCCLELATGAKAKIEPGKQLTLAGMTLPLDALSQVAVAYPKVDRIDYLSLCDLLSGRTPAQSVKNRIVVIAFEADSKNLPMVQTPIGKITAERAFCYELYSLYAQLHKQ